MDDEPAVALALVAVALDLGDVGVVAACLPVGKAVERCARFGEAGRFLARWRGKAEARVPVQEEHLVGACEPVRACRVERTPSRMDGPVDEETLLLQGRVPLLLMVPRVGRFFARRRGDLLDEVALDDAVAAEPLEEPRQRLQAPVGRRGPELRRRRRKPGRPAV